MSIKKILSGIWYTFLTICVLLFVIFFIKGMLQPKLKVNVTTLKNGDSSVFWVENEEKVIIELTNVEVNGDYTLKKFPSDKDYRKLNIHGQGKQFIKPGEKVMFFTKHLHNSDGKKFNSYSLAFTKITVWAEVDGDLRWFTGE
ncbi:MAG: hypothetical protein IH852_00355 [Bacteroidetes bacterium]|nr:hypothetical protein [Bacteroidota bacterium]